MSCSSAADEPARIVGVLGAGEARLARRGRRRSRGAGRGSAGGGHCTKPAGVSTDSDPRDVVGARRPRPQRARRSGPRGATAFIARQNTKSKSWSTNGSRNSRDDAGREHEQEQHEEPVRAGTGTSAAATPPGSTRSMSAEPSSGGIGSRLNSPRNRFTTANENRIWMPSGRSSNVNTERHRRSGRRAPGPRARRRPSARSSWPARRGSRRACRGAGCACGRVHRHRLGPREHRERRASAPIAGRTIEPNGSMCGIGLSVSRPASLAVSSPNHERDDAVADLVQDDRDDEAAEEDDRLLESSVHGARAAALSGAATRSRCRAAPPASPRAAPRGSRWWHDSHSP